VRQDKFITRNEQNSRSPFWWVRFTFGSGKDSRCKTQACFYDWHYGSKENALRAARVWRDKTIIKHPEYVINKSSTTKLGCKHTRPRGRCPDVGVSLCTRKGRRPSYIASWHETINGKRAKKGKNFPFDPNDPNDQKRQYENALELRRKMEQLHYTGDLKYKLLT